MENTEYTVMKTKNGDDRQSVQMMIRSHRSLMLVNTSDMDNNSCCQQVQGVYISSCITFFPRLNELLRESNQNKLLKIYFIPQHYFNKIKPLCTSL
jgi:hypothetical protein